MLVSGNKVLKGKGLIILWHFYCVFCLLLFFNTHHTSSSKQSQNIASLRKEKSQHFNTQQLKQQNISQDVVV